MNFESKIYFLAGLVVFFFMFSFLSSQAQDTTFSSISAVEFQKLIISKPGIVVDVRTPEEYNSGHIASAMNLNIHDKDFNERITRLDSTKNIYLYCEDGTRSSKAATIL